MMTVIPGQKAARTRRLRQAGRKAALTRKRRAAGRKAAITRRRRAAGRKAARTRIKRLTNAKRKDLARRVKIVSDRPGFGYDVKSYESDGRDKYIEVKNVTNGHRFFLSEGEWLNSRKRKNYWFYLVDEGKGRHPLISCVKAEQLTQRNLEPVQYLVRY